jgi:hypothetical protein
MPTKKEQTVGEEGEPTPNLGVNVKLTSKKREGIIAAEESLAERFTIAYESKLLTSDDGGYHRFLILVGGVEDE